MIFVDTNVFIYAVGGAHPLRVKARAFFRAHIAADSRRLVSSVEVMQELMHVYLPVGRSESLDAAMQLVNDMMHEVWALLPADVHHARGLFDAHPELSARDLVHMACCQRRGVKTIKTFDRKLAAAMGSGGR